MVYRVKRVYDAPAVEDGLRVLVDRLWPRGLTKEKAQVDLWLKDVAPSTELRRWFHHEHRCSTSSPRGTTPSSTRIRRWPSSASWARRIPSSRCWSARATRN